MKTHIIIGASAAGIAAVRTLQKHEPDARIICISDEQELPYNTCFLADFVAQDKQEKDLYIFRHKQNEQTQVEFHLGARVTAIVSDTKSVVLHHGGSVTYDTLLIATGAGPKLYPDADRFENMYTFHTLHDAQTMICQARKPHVRDVLIIGAGLSGLELADALSGYDLRITVIEQQEHLLPSHLTERGSDFLKKCIQNSGVRLLSSQTVFQNITKDLIVTDVELSDGTSLPADLIVATVGLQQRTTLAEQAGIAVGPHGIVVDEHMQTSIPDVYAAGDVVQTCDLLTGRQVASCTWPDAMQQGMHAALAMAGKPKPYKGASVIISSAFFEKKYFSCGPFGLDDPMYTITEREGEDFYHRYVLKDGILVGFTLLGNTKLFPKLRRAVLLKQPWNL